MRVRLAIALLLLSGVACTRGATKPDAAPSETPARRCLSVARIDRTEIVDDSTILVHMRDGAIWRNQLPQRCHGLRMQNGFGYATSLDQLCDLDVIQVLGGSRSACGLGSFEAYEPPQGPSANAFDAG